MKSRFFSGHTTVASQNCLDERNLWRQIFVQSWRDLIYSETACERIWTLILLRPKCEEKKAFLSKFFWWKGVLSKVLRKLWEHSGSRQHIGRPLHCSRAWLCLCILARDRGRGWRSWGGVGGGGGGVRGAAPANQKLLPPGPRSCSLAARFLMGTDQGHKLPQVTFPGNLHSVCLSGKDSW